MKQEIAEEWDRDVDLNWKVEVLRTSMQRVYDP